MPPECVCSVCKKKYEGWGLEEEMKKKGFIKCTTEGCKGKMKITVGEVVDRGPKHDNWDDLHK